MKNAFKNLDYFCKVPQILYQFHVWMNVLVHAKARWNPRNATSKEDKDAINKLHDTFMSCWDEVMHADSETWEEKWQQLQADYDLVCRTLMDYIRSEWMTCHEELLDAFLE